MRSDGLEDLAARRVAADITLPQLLRLRAKAHPDALAIREKEHGIWKRFSWAHYHETARLVAFGLISLGLQRGDRVAIASENTPEWYYADLGGEMLGAPVIGIYPTNPWPELQYIVRHCGARVVFTGDQEQTDKVLDAIANGDGLPAIGGRGAPEQAGLGVGRHGAVDVDERRGRRGCGWMPGGAYPQTGVAGALVPVRSGVKVDDMARVVDAGKRATQFVQRIRSEGGDPRPPAGAQHASDLVQRGCRVAPLQRQAGPQRVDLRIANRQRFEVGAQQAGTRRVAWLAQHRGGEVDGEVLRRLEPVEQRAGAHAGAAAGVDERAHRCLGRMGARQREQLLADLALHGGGAVVAGCGPVEGRAHTLLTVGGLSHR